MKKEFNEEKTKKLEEIASKHNATLIPEHKGYARIDGPRRQYEAIVKGRMLVYTEK